MRWDFDGDLRKEQIEVVLKAFDCPNCGGLVEAFDEATKRGVCPYCNSLLFDIPALQDVYGTKASSRAEADQMLRRVDDFILIGKRGKAVSALREYVDKYPADFRGWYKLCEIDSSSDFDVSFEKDVVESARITVALAGADSWEKSMRALWEAFGAKREKLAEVLHDLRKEEAELAEAERILKENRKGVDDGLQAAAKAEAKLSEEYDSAVKAHCCAQDAHWCASRKIKSEFPTWILWFAAIGAAIGAVRVLASWGDISGSQGFFNSLVLVPATAIVYALIDGGIGAVAGLLFSAIVWLVLTLIYSKKTSRLAAREKEALERYQAGQRKREKKKGELTSLSEKIMSNIAARVNLEDRMRGLEAKMSTAEEVMEVIKGQRA